MRDQFDEYRRALVNEPRGSEVMVGALLVPTNTEGCDLGVIFFNNVGYLGMCGHGTIGVVETLHYLGRLAPGKIVIDTCVGTVSAELCKDRRISVSNVASFRVASQIPLELEHLPTLHADVAYGGNWFCLVHCPDPTWLDRPIKELLLLSERILTQIRQYFPQVDHVELFGPPIDPQNDSRSFVLCPGGAYDRSPCGTGTSAKLACLAADGKLPPKNVWRQESIIGSVFEASYHWLDRSKGHIAPTITSKAYVNADCRIVVAADDPFAWGIN
jgi:proline racemase